MADEAAPQARPGQVVSRGEMRASHDDRDGVVELLRVSAGDGRISPEELDERVEAALTARTYNELTALVADLPNAPGAAPAAMSAPPAQPREVVRIDCNQGNADRVGRWVLPQRMEVRVRHGNVKLDFTQAEIVSPTLQIDVEMRHSNLTLATRPGIVVNTDDVAIHGSNIRHRPPPDTGVPIMLRIDVSGQVHHSNLQVGPPRPPRRTFWQWLTRQPRPGALPPGPAPGALPPGRI